jgi:hypothetical protein
MPETKKKPKKPRAKRAVKSKKGLKQKQKQRQQVNVNVSAGGSGGGGYIPIPQAPEINYSLLSQLIRPANTVDVPIRAAAPVPEPVFVRPAEPESLASELKPKRSSSASTQTPFIATPAASDFYSPAASASAQKPFIATPAASDFYAPYASASESEGEFMVAKARKVRSDAGTTGIRKTKKKPSQESHLAEMERQQKELAREGERFRGPSEGDIGRRFEKLPAIQRAGFSSIGGARD